jgi:ABC-type phosphate transport system auxiliary subunit
MAVMARETWTDERIDDFKENVNQRLDQVEKRMDERFDHVDREFQRVDRRFDRVEGSIEGLRQTMVHGFFVLVGIQAMTILTMVGLKFL